MRKQSASDTNVIDLRQRKPLTETLQTPIPSSDSSPNRSSNIPDATFVRSVHMKGALSMDDGHRVTTWGFTEGKCETSQVGEFPSPIMRVKQGQLIETKLVNNMVWQHSLKHHGVLQELIKPDSVCLDDTDEVFTYRWKAIQPGTFFYFCDSSRLLHREMGMYGVLVIDPPKGPGTLYASGPSYDHEFIWACDEIDSSLHRNAIDALVVGGKAGFNPPHPDYFVINGIDGTRSTLDHPGIAPRVKKGDSLLIRYICAGYLAQRVHFGGLKADIHMANSCILPNAVCTGSIEAMPSECYDCIIQCDAPGNYDVCVEFLHWKTGQRMGTADTRITVE